MPRMCLGSKRALCLRRIINYAGDGGGCIEFPSLSDRALTANPATPRFVCVRREQQTTIEAKACDC
jgi:hypothetical protein